MAKYSSTSKDKAAELHAELQQGIENLVSSADWQQALDVAAKFHNYSFGNTLLILWQRPEATRVAGYRKWQELKRQVRKGQRAIRILAPSTRTITETDPETGEEQKRTIVAGFRVVSVFDISQTDGEPLADMMPEFLTGDGVEGLFESLLRQVTDHGFTFANCDAARIAGANGATDHDTKTVYIREDLDRAQQTKTLAHELAHVLLHPDTNEYRKERHRCEVEAESIAYVVCQAAGLPTVPYSLPYVAHWANGDAELVAKTGQRVIQTAHKILDELAITAELVAA